MAISILVELTNTVFVNLTSITTNIETAELSILIVLVSFQIKNLSARKITIFTLERFFLE